MAKSGFVTIAGRPNAGKSTLLNRILKTDLSIVTPKAQTTRERVLGILSEKKKGQIVFVDTPGIHQAKEGGINASMMAEVREALDGVSAVWYIVDPNSLIKAEKVVLELLKSVKAPVFLLMNKADLKFSSGVSLELDILQAAKEIGVEFTSVHRISAYKGREIEPLLAQTWALMPEGVPHYPDPDQLSDRPTRFFVSEKIREQLLLQLGDELPYCCAVEIENFDEESKPPRIEAIIHVERESQKGMVIGKGAVKIKQIGSEARKTIERFMGEKVFLGLKVKLLKDWSKDAEALRRLGYNLPPSKGSGKSKKKTTGDGGKTRVKADEK